MCSKLAGLIQVLHWSLLTEDLAMHVHTSVCWHICTYEHWCVWKPETDVSHVSSLVTFHLSFWNRVPSLNLILAILDTLAGQVSLRDCLSLQVSTGIQVCATTPGFFFFFFFFFFNVVWDYTPRRTDRALSPPALSLHINDKWWIRSGRKSELVSIDLFWNILACNDHSLPVIIEQ